ncbi:hypothetical protein THAOC_17430, partial [Thalassiosira oceanica]
HAGDDLRHRLRDGELRSLRDEGEVQGQHRPERLARLRRVPCRPDNGAFGGVRGDALLHHRDAHVVLLRVEAQEQGTGQAGALLLGGIPRGGLDHILPYFHKRSDNTCSGLRRGERNISGGGHHGACRESVGVDAHVRLLGDREARRENSSIDPSLRVNNLCQYIKFPFSLLWLLDGLGDHKPPKVASGDASDADAVATHLSLCGYVARGVGSSRPVSLLTSIISKGGVRIVDSLRRIN